MRVLISEKIAAENAYFEVRNRNSKTLVANGLSGSEEIEIQGEYADGQFCDIYASDGSQFVMSATKNIFVVSAPGRYKVAKPITSAAVTVGMHEAKL